MIRRYLCATFTLLGFIPAMVLAEDEASIASIRAQLVQQGALAEDINPNRVTLRSDFKGDDDALALIAQLPDVETLFISEAKISGQGLKHLEKLKNLKTLSISHTGMKAEAVAHLAKLPIVTLSLHGVPLRHEQFEVLTKLMSLKSLSVSGPSIDDAAIEPLLEGGNLSRLQLLGTSLTDSSIAHLKSFAELEYLSVEESSRVSPAALTKLWNDLPKLRIVGPTGGIPASKGQPLGFSGED